ncbi:DDE-type integrase/transposase/recombinase [Rhodococcus qingshengii]|uniref:DDE-type integrase/transposase/recombinase n=1 Tax=Rhodococcus qingshengii TaxID=334542 RepID=UPI0036DD64CA
MQTEILKRKRRKKRTLLRQVDAQAGSGTGVLLTDKLTSYVVAHRELLPSAQHRRSKYLNNRAENSHQSTR